MSKKTTANLIKSGLASFVISFVSACVSIPSYSGSGQPNMGELPSIQAREASIAAEPTGNFLYGRRYHVNKTRFWGYLRKPRQPWTSAKLSVMNESLRNQPDRLSEDGPKNHRHGYDQNFDYKIFGSYTGRKVYDPNSNLFLPEFKPTKFELLNTSPGWLFSQQDHYNSSYITLVNESVNQQN